MITAGSFRMASCSHGSRLALRRSCGALLLGFGLVASFSCDTPTQVEAAMAAPYRNLAPDNSYNMGDDSNDEWSLEELSGGAFDLGSASSDTVNSPKQHREETEDILPSAYRSTWVPFREAESQEDAQYFAADEEQAMEPEIDQPANESIPNEYYDAIESSNSSWMSSA